MFIGINQPLSDVLNLKIMPLSKKFICCMLTLGRGMVPKNKSTMRGIFYSTDPRS